ncbi:hypothetical protein AB0C93_27065 [Streptomyces sp. NPDC048518]|uniref:hypothetical protein n=1 Tax=Streptomyces sp. NPDC048518 TaxID=3155029 RepID=UPI0034077711
MFVCGWCWGRFSWLWERLSGWQKDQVEAAAKTALARLEGLLVLPGVRRGCWPAGSPTAWRRPAARR